MIHFTRRDRFVLAASLSFGFADLLLPRMFTNLFNGVNNPNTGLRGLFDSITIVLSTPCELVGLVIFHSAHQFFSSRSGHRGISVESYFTTRT